MAQHWLASSKQDQVLQTRAKTGFGSQLEQDTGIRGQADLKTALKYKRFKHKLSSSSAASLWSGESSPHRVLFIQSSAALSHFLHPIRRGEWLRGESALPGMSCHRPFKCIFAKSFPSEGFSLPSSFFNPQMKREITQHQPQAGPSFDNLCAAFSKCVAEHSELGCGSATAKHGGLALITNPLLLPPFSSTWMRSQIKT